MAIIGSGGIGFDVATYLSHESVPEEEAIRGFLAEWGVDPDYKRGGALREAQPSPSPRTIYMLKRSVGKHGAQLGKTTGWIHRLSLKNKNVQRLSGAQYQKISDEGLHILVRKKPMTLDVDHIIICAGQHPLRDLYDSLADEGKSIHLIGGAKEAGELDAKRAIDEGSRLAASL